MVPRCLTIAASDSGGGDGIQADLKAFARLGCHGMSAIVALTAQNTVEVAAVHEAPPEFIRAHRSYIVNIRHITKIEGSTVWLGKHSVPVGESYRDVLLARLPILR